MIACIFSVALRVSSAFFRSLQQLCKTRFLRGAAAAALAACLGVANWLPAQTSHVSATNGNFGSVNVGAVSASPIALTFTFDTAGTPGSTAVLTQGATSLDFASAGGTCTANTAYSAGQSCTVKVSFRPKLPGTRYGAAELLDTSGNLLAIGYVQGTGVGPQVSFARITSGVYVPSSQKDVGSGFDRPYAVAIDGSGNAFVADTYNNAVKEVMASGGYATVKRISSSLTFPTGLAVDGGGNLFVADQDSNSVKEIVAAGGYATINTLGSGFNRPSGVAVDGSGNVFVADEDNSAVKEILAAGGYTTVNTLGSGFDFPTGVAVDASGNVFVADAYNDAVKEILAAGGYTTVKTLASGFHHPTGVALDGIGNVLVADFVNDEVKEILAEGGYSTVLTLSSGFHQPQGVATDGKGNVFVGDLGDSLAIELVFANPPKLQFQRTNVGSESGDSPQNVTVLNMGNAGLTFPVPTSGSNPSLPAGFKLDDVTTCPNVTSSSVAGTLAGAAECVYAVDFVPVSLGTSSGSLTLTDSNLNAGAPNFATQSIGLTGPGITTPVITWATPAPIVFGTALSATQLNATANVAGTFTYSPAAGTVLTAGTHKLNVTFVPTDSADHPSATASVLLQVTRQVPAITWVTPAPITFGTALGATQLDATSQVSGTFTYTPAAGTVLAGGTHKLNVTFTPNDLVDYTTATSSVLLTVGRQIPVVTWANPASITYGAALSATQLDATANVSGTFAYTPAAGTVLTAGTHKLNVTFTPADSTDFATTTVSVSLAVKKAVLTVTANNATRAQGAANPAFTDTITGFVHGETQSVVSGMASLTTTATTSSPAGTYAIVAAQGTLAAANYVFKFVNGVLTVTQ